LEGVGEVAQENKSSISINYKEKKGKREERTQSARPLNKNRDWV